MRYLSIAVYDGLRKARPLMTVLLAASLFGSCWIYLMRSAMAAPLKLLGFEDLMPGLECNAGKTPTFYVVSS